MLFVIVIYIAPPPLEIHFALVPIIVIKEFLPMSLQFLCNDSFINRPKINTGNIVQHRRNIRAIQHSGKDADVVEIQFQEILGRGLNQGELDIRYCRNFCFPSSMESCRKSSGFLIYS